MTYHTNRDGQAEFVPSEEAFTALGRAVWQASRLLRERPTVVYESSHSLACLPGELPTSDWHKEA